MPEHRTNGVAVEELHEALAVSQIQARQLLHTAVGRKKVITELEHELEQKNRAVRELEVRLEKLEQRMLRQDGSDKLVARKDRSLKKLQRKLSATQEWLATARQRGDKLFAELTRKTERIQDLELQLRCATPAEGQDEALKLLRKTQAAHRRLKSEQAKLSKRVEDLQSRYTVAQQQLAEKSSRVEELEKLVVKRRGPSPEELERKVEELTRALKTEREARLRLERERELFGEELSRICRRESRPEGQVLEFASLRALERTLETQDTAIAELRGEVHDYDERLRQLKSRLEVSQLKAESLRKKLLKAARSGHAENLVITEQEQRIAQLSGELEEAQGQLEDERNITRALRAMMQRHAPEEFDPSRSLVEELEQILASREQMLDDLRGIASRREQKLRDLGRLAETRQQEAQRLSREIADRDSQLQELSGRLATQDEALGSLQALAGERAARIESLEKSLWDKESRIDELSAVVHGQTEKIQALEELIGERDSRLEELQGRDRSRSSRITELENVVAVWEGKGHELERLLSQRVARISELEELVDERASRIRQLERAVQERNRVVAELEQNLVEDGRLQELELEAGELRARLRDLDALTEAQCDELQRWEAEVAELRELLTLREGHIRELESSLSARDEQAREMEELLGDLDAQGDERVRQLEESLAEQRARAAELAGALEELEELLEHDDEREKQLSELRRQVGEREEQLVDYEQEVDLRDEHIAELQQLLDELEGQDEERLETIRGLESALQRERRRFQELNTYKVGERRADAARIAELENTLLIREARIKTLETELSRTYSAPEERPGSDKDETVIAVRDQLLQARIRADRLEDQLVQAMARLGELDLRESEIEQLRLTVAELEDHVRSAEEARQASCARSDELRARLTQTQQEMARLTLDLRAVERRREQERAEEQSHIRKLKEDNEVQSEELLVLRSKVLQLVAATEQAEIKLSRLSNGAAAQ